MGDFFRELGLVESAKKIYVTLIQQLEREYGESHGTIVYSAYNQSWQYKCKHPDVIKVSGHYQAILTIFLQDSLKMDFKPLGTKYCGYIMSL